jgi:hypothetical protein
MFGTMLISVGTLLVISGAVASWRHRTEAARARRILRLPQKRIVDLPAGEPARIEGKIVPQQALLVAPCSGEAAVWFRVRLREFIGSAGGGDGGGGALWRTLVEEEFVTPFWVEDAFGGRARIIETEPQLSASARITTFKTLSPEGLTRLRLVLSERGHEFTGADVYEEQCLHAGDVVNVVGLSRLEPGPTQPNLYRDAPSVELVVQGGTDQELIVVSSETLRYARGGVYLAGRIAIVVGTLVLACGFIVRLVMRE